jgi:hypothetical protein
MPLLVGLALLSMAAGTRYGQAAPVTSTAVPAAARLVPAGPIAGDTRAPAGFAATVDGVRRAQPDMGQANDSSGQWGASRVVPVAVATAPAPEDSHQPAAAPPLVLSRTTVPAALGSRAPPVA